MREIKFRAFNTRKNFLSHRTSKENPGFIKEMVYFNPLKEMDGNLIVPSMSYIEEEAVVMQYTGLKDKNGVDIYEGDILEYEGGEFDGNADWIIGKYRTEVYWYDGSTSEPYGTNGKPGFTFGNYSVRVHGDCEVIGNIWENPELLEDK